MDKLLKASLSIHTSLKKIINKVRLLDTKILEYKEENILVENKIFKNVRDRLRLQKREYNLFRITWKHNKKNWALNPSHIGVIRRPVELTNSEISEVRRLAIKIPTITSCHINYLLGINKCLSIHNYLILNEEEIKAVIDEEIQNVNIKRYLDKNSYIIPQKKPKKGRREQSDMGIELNNESYYIPCHHDGMWSKDHDWDWFLNGKCCEKFCHCASFWDKRFPGCSWNGKCNPTSCIWIKANREWDPELWKTCNSHINQEGLKLKGKNLPMQSNLCKNVDILYQRKRRLFVGKSKVCPSLGLFAGEVIEPGEYICIYSGEILSEFDSENRGIVQDIIEETYLFTLNSRYVVDASKVGNIMRYANHASGQHINAFPKIIAFVQGGQAIGLYANKRIEIGQEILFDYNFQKNFEWLKVYHTKYKTAGFV